MPWRCGATPLQMRFRLGDIDIYRIDKAISCRMSAESLVFENPGGGEMAGYLIGN